MKTSQILKEMKKQLLVRGWTQKDFENSMGQVCIMGSLTRTEVITKVNQEAANRGMKALRDTIYGEGQEGGVTRWNDVPGRTVEEVYLVLDQAILNEERKEASCDM